MFLFCFCTRCGFGSNIYIVIYICSTVHTTQIRAVDCASNKLRDRGDVSGFDVGSCAVHIMSLHRLFG